MDKYENHREEWSEENRQRKAEPVMIPSTVHTIGDSCETCGQNLQQVDDGPDEGAVYCSECDEENYVRSILEYPADWQDNNHS